jgi:hypothetical protein
MSADESVHEALSAELERPAPDNTFTIVEFDKDGISIWTVVRDDYGTPRASRSRLPALSAGDLGDFYDREMKPLLGRRLAVIARCAPDYPAELVGLVSERHHAPVRDCGPVEPLLRHAIENSPLSVPYDLVVLRQEQGGRDPAGRLRLHSVPLFPLRASSGYHAEVTVRCAPTDEYGTVLAVVTRIADPRGRASDRRFGLIEVRSGAMAPGVHTLTAWLARPGHTMFDVAGEPLQLTRETRSWQQILAAIPDRPPSAQPIHLICAVEVSGGAKALKDRVSRLVNVITASDDGSRPLTVSVIAYGPHSVERSVREEPVAVLSWARSADRAIAALRGLDGGSRPQREYQRAAQVECALRSIADNLTVSDGRAVLVTAGSRPPHPPRVDRHTEILPCPHGVSWRTELDRLHKQARDLALGALCDKDAAGEIWRELGYDAIAHVETVDTAEFAERIGLRDPAMAVPFPLFVEQRGL